MLAPLPSKELLNYLLEGDTLMPDQLDHFIRAHPDDEDQYFDYKNGVITTRQQRDEGRKTIREYVSGFANSDGGTLIIGVDESRPRKIASCESRSGGPPLDQWASRCLHDMVASFSPQPRLQVINHSQDYVLAIAVARAPSLVPCIEARELKSFFQIGDSTLPAPEYLIADLVLGRRQHPLLDMHPRPIQERIVDPKSLDERDTIPARSATFAFDVENLSLATAEDVNFGLVLWSLLEGPTEDINRHLRSYLDICDIKPGSFLGSQFRLVHRASGSSGEKYNLAPFQKLTIRIMNPFYFPREDSARVVGGVYVISRGVSPTWFQ